MNSSAGAARCPRSTCLPVAALALVFFVLAAVPVQGQDRQSLYSAEVPTDPRDPSSRDDAYREALARVVVRVTGARQPPDPELLREWFPNPSRYVLQYRPAEGNMLRVTLDGAAIEEVLRHQRQTVWGADRPLTIVWLAVDWGQGEREIVAADDPEGSTADARASDRNRPLRERIQEVAAERGIPVAFPLLDAEELGSIRFSDIWGGFNDPILEASQRYGANSVLVGRIRPESMQENRWSWYFADDRREWFGEPDETVQMLADTLAERFAIAGDAQLHTVELTISGIDSVAAYGAVQSFMEGLDVIENLAVDEVRGDSIHYRLRAHGGVERLRQALAANRRLEPVEDPGGGTFAPIPGELEYRYRR